MTNPFSFGYNVYNNIFAYQPPMYYPYQGQYFMPYGATRYMTPSYNVQPYSSSYYYPSFGTVTSSYKPAVRSNSESSKVKSSAKTKKTKKTTKISTKNKLSELDKLGYSKEIGQKLAQDAVNNIKKVYDKEKPECATYVKNAIKRCGLGEYIRGDAYKCADILRKNPNFKEVKIAGKDLKKLPAGCIIVYPQGDADYSPEYGHIEISLGNGKAVSDFVNNDIKASDNAAVFIPIDA